MARNKSKSGKKRTEMRDSEDGNEYFLLPLFFFALKREETQKKEEE